ncbi:hypothetical protein PPYR_00614 [Photinus pyralis]|uniref:Uncharacterized protein n=2 Tax=Photinus pyralis TaxID=7054 RepID=A0A5N4B245_PHOPY|nr:uncharacterized protein LOC116182193 [Photinus pyralis]KAB0803644.1 hypothetical protein PPYR_00614 [Photinus pyralis]
MNLELYLVVGIATAIAGVPVPEKEEVSPKGRNLVIVEPFYNQYEFMDDDPEAIAGFEDENEIMYPTGSLGDLEVAESNIVFRPLFAYRKQMAKRRRVYTQPSVATLPSPLPSRRKYVFRYPVFKRNPQYEHVQYDYVP